MKINLDTLIHICALDRALEEPNIPVFQASIDEVSSSLLAISALKELDCSDKLVLASPLLEDAPLRSDIAQKCDHTSQIVACSAHHSENLYVVKKFL